MGHFIRFQMVFLRRTGFNLKRLRNRELRLNKVGYLTRSFLADKSCLSNSRMGEASENFLGKKL